jgi:hypothetical protein
LIKRKPLLLAYTGATYAGGWQMPLPHLGLKPAKALRDKVSARYDEAVSYTMPGRDGINMGPDQSDIYDDTAVLAVPEFASRMQQGVIPNFSQWASFVAGALIEDADEKDELKKALERVDRYLFEMINSSNFAVEANEALIDLSLGTMCLRIDEGIFENPFNARAVPLRSLLFCIGADGRPDPIYEVRKIPIGQIHVHYPDATLPEELMKGRDIYYECEVVEAWHRDWSEPAALKYRQSVFLTEHDHRVIFEKWVQGAGAAPLIAARWSKATGEGWGRGPLVNCLPSIRKVNYAERALLDHTDVALAGIWTMEDDGVVNTSTVRLEPGTLVPVAMGSAGLKNVAPGANFDIAAFVLKEARSNIKKALYTEQLGAPEGTPMSATEVQQRMAELARAIGSPFGRLIVEFVMPVIIRCIRILTDKGLIKMPKVDGKRIKLIATSPLAQSQRFELIDALTSYAQALVQALGQDAVNIVIDGTEFSDELADAMLVPRRILRPPAKQKEILAMIAQNAAGAQGGQPGEQPGSGGGAPA